MEELFLIFLVSFLAVAAWVCNPDLERFTNHWRVLPGYSFAVNDLFKCPLPCSIEFGSRTDQESQKPVAQIKAMKTPSKLV